MTDFFGRLVKLVFAGRPTPEGAAVVQPIKIASGIPSRIPITDSVQFASVGLGMVPTTDGASIATTSATRRGILVRGFAAQTANLVELQDSGSVELFSIDPAGNINAPATVGFKLAGAPALTLGTPKTSVAPVNVQISATGGLGTNVAGASVTYAAGQGTGLGLGGHHIFKTAPAGGSGSALNALVTILELTDDAKVGFFGVDPAAQQVDIGALTDSTGGSVDNTVAAVSGSGADATINNNFADLTDQINQLRTTIRNLGLMA